jgi:hypothetical protein
VRMTRQFDEITKTYGLFYVCFRFSNLGYTIRILYLTIRHLRPNTLLFFLIYLFIYLFLVKTFGYCSVHM